jgi:multicomponent Na+:H+ antiporter subunit F
MTGFYHAFALLLLLSLLGGLVRILRGPTRADRMLAAQLFGSSGVAILLVLAEGAALPALRDVALVFALLAMVNAVAFVGRATPARGEP